MQTTSHSTPSTGARWVIVILACETARAYDTSTDIPPRKWRIRAPRSNPSRLAWMKSSQLPWNQVAIIRPSSCQTVRNRSQSPASRQTTQFSTSRRIAASSVGIFEQLRGIAPFAKQVCGVETLGVLAQLLRRAVMDDPPVLDHVRAFGERQRHVDELLDQQ